MADHLPTQPIPTGKRFNGFADLAGMTFGRWRVVSYAGKMRTANLWNCECCCGKQKVVFAQHLSRGKSQSCGCLAKEMISARATTHGQSRPKAWTREYRAWSHIISRTTNPNVPTFKYYGGRGIKVCERWRTSFQAFFDDMGVCPAGKSIDRINNDGNYEPGNCRWATHKEQMNNTRRSKANRPNLQSAL